MISPRAAGRCAALALSALAAAAGAQPLPGRGGGRVLVMPFESASRDSRLSWLGEASAVLLGEDLAARGVDVMTRDDRLGAFGELQVPARASLSHATIIKVGELVGASDVVIGTLALEGDRLTARVRSVQLVAGRMRPEVVDTGPLSDLFATFDRLAQQMSGASAPPEADSGRAHPPLPAFENYIKGLLAETPAAQIKFLQAALAAYASYDAARVALWQVFTAAGDPARALATAAAIPGGSTYGRQGAFLAALSQIALRRYDQAFTRLRALGDDEPAAAISNNLGVILLRHGSVSPQDRATSFLGQAVASDPRDPDYAFNLGYAWWLEKNPAEAIKWLRETVRLSPGDADAHLVLGVALGATAEGDRELDLARRLSSRYADLEKKPAALAALVPQGLERVRDDLRRGMPSLVETTTATAELRQQSELAAFHRERAQRLYENQQDREALIELRRAIYLAPYEASSHLLAARIHLRANRSAEAIGAAKIAIWCEDGAAAHVVLGEAYLQAKDPQLARTEAWRALALDPASADARHLLERIPDKQVSIAPSALPGV